MNLLIKVMTTSWAAVEVHVMSPAELRKSGDVPREEHSSAGATADPMRAEAEFVFGHLRPQSD